MVEAQEDLTWERWHTIIDRVEVLGFESIWRSDHYLTDQGEPEREALEAWISFATLADRTSKVRFGPLVSPMTFRHPSVLAIMAACVDQLSGGRLELGLGAGWFTEEHKAFGVPFYNMPIRFEMLREGIEVIESLWTTDNVSFEGKHYQLENATCYPKPTQTPRPPIIIGGVGEKYTLPIAAKYADEWNSFSIDATSYKAKRDVLTTRCEELGRDPSTIKCSWMGPVLTGHSEKEMNQRLDNMRRALPAVPEVANAPSPASLRDHAWLVGTPQEVVEQLGGLMEAGAERFMLQTYNVDDMEILEIIATEIMPQVA